MREVQDRPCDACRVCGVTERSVIVLRDSMGDLGLCSVHKAMAIIFAGITKGRVVV